MTDAASGARVLGLWRYPVKSLQGEAVPSLTLGPLGVEGDRRWAVLDPATGRALSAKTVPALLEAAAATTATGVELALPDGTTLEAGGDGCDAALSAWLGRPVTLAPAETTATSYDMTFDPPNDAAELVEIPMPEGSFVDLFPVHLLTTGSLATAAATYPGGEWDVRRFRPNVLVEVDGNEFPEDAWVGGPLGVGGATLQVVMRTVRCAIPLRAQPASAGGGPLPRDVGVFRALSAVHDNHLGAYCEVAAPGTVALGDAVRPGAPG